jgi:hypothetical protein
VDLPLTHALIVAEQPIPFEPNFPTSNVDLPILLSSFDQDIPFECTTSIENEEESLNVDLSPRQPTTQPPIQPTMQVGEPKRIRTIAPRAMEPGAFSFFFSFLSEY